MHDLTMIIADNETVGAGAPDWDSCDQCHLLSECGGLDDLDRGLGCFPACRQRGCGSRFTRKGTPAWVCLCRPEEFTRASREAGGICFTPPVLKGPDSGDAPPLFAPTIQHNSSRVAALDAPMVALPLPEVLAFVRRPSVSLTPQSLREHFRLAPSSRVILLCACVDPTIETLWSVRTTEEIAQKLALLGLWAATLPNYSFFRDAPRPDVLINRRRSLIVGGEWTQAGIPVIPHLNALTIGDWDYWLTLLRHQPHITYVTKEFQTGLRNQPQGRAAVEQLARLQDKLGRELRPVIIGGTQYLPQVAQHFASPTFIESTPFMLTRYRQKIIDTSSGASVAQMLTVRQERHPTGDNEPLDDLLRVNVGTREAGIKAAWQEAIRIAAARRGMMKQLGTGGCGEPVGSTNFQS